MILFDTNKQITWRDEGLSKSFYKRTNGSENQCVLFEDESANFVYKKLWSN